MTSASAPPPTAAVLSAASTAPSAASPTTALAASAPSLGEQLRTLKTLLDVASFLGYANYGQVASVIYPSPRYRNFVLRKRSGGNRPIAAPNRNLKVIQRRLAEALLELYGKGREPVHSFVKGKGIHTNAARHTRRTFVLRVDLESFFSSVHFGRVRGTFTAPPLSLPEPVATVLAHICCYRGSLPQGAPSSPILTNFVCRGLDAALVQLAKECRATYTRYCDDLIFSFTRRRTDQLPPRIVSVSSGRPVLGEDLLSAISGSGFTVNASKTRLHGVGSRQTVTGIVVNDFPNVPREYYESIRVALYAWEKHGYVSASANVRENLHERNYSSRAIPPLHRIVWGKIQHLRMVKSQRDAPLIALAWRFNRLLKRDAALLELPVSPQIRVVPTVSYAKDARAATWFVEASGGKGDTREGSAFYVRDVGFVTCAHCLLLDPIAVKPKLHNAIHLFSHDRRYKLEVKILKIDYDFDFAVLEPGLDFVPNDHLAFEVDAALPIVGTPVVVCGYPGHVAHRPPVIYPSNVSRVLAVNGRTRIEIDRDIRPGASGGPLLRASDAKVIGIVSTYEVVKKDYGSNSAIPIREALK
jgi:RNA-directed DNA polymerase